MNNKLIRIIGQSLLIVVFSTALALAVNGFRSRGLSLSRNYFENTKPLSHNATSESVSVQPTEVAAGTPKALPSQPEIESSTADATQTQPDPIERDQADPYPVGETGFREIQTRQVHELLTDARAESLAILFVDARNDEYYQAGHIPRAVQFDHYYADQYMPDVLPLAQAAEWVVIYCGGGDCEDSIMAANDLLMEGVPQERILLYKGGWKEWTDAGHPQEPAGDE